MARQINASTVVEATTVGSMVNVQETAGNSELTGGRNMANLVLFMSATGFVHNVLLTGFQIFSLIYSKQTATWRTFQFSSYFSSTARHAVNFVQFYWFNAAFRRAVRGGAFGKLTCLFRERRTVRVRE
jgi:hypothetical protein